MVHNQNTMTPNAKKDDTASLSTASTSGRMSSTTRNTYTYAKKPPHSPKPSNVRRKREKRNSPPPATVRRISWDNCSLENNKKDKRKISRWMSGCNPLIEALAQENGNGNSSGSGSNPQESLNGRHNEDDKKSSKAVTIGRELFVVFILVVAGVFGSMSYHVLKISEENLAKQQYFSVTDGALMNVRNLAENKLVHGSQIMAKHVGWSYPNAEDWPFVWIASYWDIMEEVLPTSVRSGVNLAPIVMPEEAQEFEEFAYQKISETFGEKSDMGATSHFGKGVWVRDEERGRTSDLRYHDTTGVPNYPGSPYNYMAPNLQDGLVFTPYTMMNVHGGEMQGLALDVVMNCSNARMDNYTQWTAIHGEEEDSQYRGRGCIDKDSEGVNNCPPSPQKSHCSALSGILPPTHIKDEHGISGFIATPIYPANDPYELVGFIFGTVYWVEVMSDIFPKNTIGIDCVFGDPAHQYTFTLEATNRSTLICEDDCHDEKYDSLKLFTTIVDPGLLSEGSVSYEMACYPNDEFFKTYKTRNPTIAAVGTVGIILFTSGLFFLYDYLVRQEFRSKKELFEAKRKFVRFVSHEVRTPMNSVCMGLSVLQEEAAATLGHETRDGKKRKKSSNGLGPDAQPSLNREQIEHWFDLTNEISSNAQASVDVLDDFLNYDKIASGEMTLEYTIIPVWKLIGDTVTEFKLPMETKKIKLHTSLSNAEELQSIAPRDPSYKSALFCSDDTMQRSNKNSSVLYGEDKGISDMEAGFKSDMLEVAENQKLVGDSVRITQVIRNLVSNAIKFSEEGGDITISTRFEETILPRRRMSETKKTKKKFELKSKEVITCETSGEIVFTIKDTGAGLSRAQLKNLFGAGVQFDVNELQSGKGSGLGLYIAKGIVEQHGGTLVADSDGKGLGCTFTMRLPIYIVPEDLLDTSQFVRRRPRTRKSFERIARSIAECEGEDDDLDNDCTLKSLDSRDDGMSELKILLVDDSKSNRKLLDRLMTMRGHRCEQADDGHRGVQMATRAEEFAQPYDLIFMDYEMPTLNGPEAVKQIRANGSDVFIIGLTGNIMAEDVSYFHACGANAVFAKPFKVREFEALMEECLLRDSQGRITEKGSAAFELSPLGLRDDNHLCDDISPLGLIEEGDMTLSCLNIDDTAISSLAEAEY